jgi:hypothetical protein
MLVFAHFVLTGRLSKCCFSSTMKLKLVRGLAGLLALVSLHSCAGPGGGYSPPAYSVMPYSEAAVGNAVTAGLRSGDAAASRNQIDAALNNPAERSGLATGWGKEKTSVVTNHQFTRSSSKPAGTDVIYYNDKKGIESMAGSPGRRSPMQSTAGGLVEWGVKSRGVFLNTYRSSGRRLVEGKPGASYMIVVRNRSKSILEIVASVDGLDVFDGKAASFAKRGYLVEPGETLEIDGFRTSWNRVAAFEFSSVGGSYANQRHGDTRNVGVLGLAVFTQKGVDPWTTVETRQRIGARAFAEAP